MRGMLSGADFGEAGRQVVIEEFLHGEEASFIVATDGETILPLASSQDHKARDNGDRVPTPAAWAPIRRLRWSPPELHERIMAEIIEPTVRGMAAEVAVMLGFSTPGDDHRRWPQGAGIQLPVG